MLEETKLVSGLNRERNWFLILKRERNSDFEILGTAGPNISGERGSKILGGKFLAFNVIIKSNSG